MTGLSYVGRANRASLKVSLFAANRTVNAQFRLRFYRIAVEAYRTTRRFAGFGDVSNSARSWTAPVLWRFRHATVGITITHSPFRGRKTDFFELSG